MSNSVEETIALLAEHHIVSHWTNLPVLELFAPALLVAFDEGQTTAILSRLEHQNVPPETLTHIRQVIAYRHQIEQLTALFHKLRQAGFPLGPEEYQLLLTALQMGKGQKREELQRLCHLIWLSSEEEKKLFNHLFKSIVKDVVYKPAAQETNTSESTSESETPNTTDTDTPQIDQSEHSGSSVPDTPPVAIPSNPTPTPLTSPRTADTSDLPPLPEDEQMKMLAEHISAEDAVIMNLEVGDTEIEYQKFMQKTDYFPVTRRRLKQNWRYLRRMVRSGPPGEVDINATVQKLAQDGFLLKPVLRPRRVNRSELLLLIDRQGSMVPFHGMGRRIEETAVESGRLGQIQTYYFHNVPPLHKDARHLPASALYRPHNLFKKPQCISAISVEEVADRFDSAYTSVLIFSDAGAARGGWNEQRIQTTAGFLYQLQALGFEDIAWLNPMPQERWFTMPDEKTEGEKKKERDQKNSATDIAKFVPMFSMDHASLFEAINTLRGRTNRKVTFQV